MVLPGSEQAVAGEPRPLIQERNGMRIFEHDMGRPRALENLAKDAISRHKA
jgi:hypothetical protein